MGHRKENHSNFPLKKRHFWVKITMQQYLIYCKLALIMKIQLCNWRNQYVFKRELNNNRYREYQKFRRFPTSTPTKQTRTRWCLKSRKLSVKWQGMSAGASVSNASVFCATYLTYNCAESWWTSWYPFWNECNNKNKVYNSNNSDAMKRDHTKMPFRYFLTRYSQTGHCVN